MELDGEIIVPENPVIRKEFSWSGANTIEPISRNNVAHLIEVAATRAGIRTHSGGKRQVVKLVHGLRKFYATSLGRANIKEAILPTLMCWSMSTRGLPAIYQTFTEEEIYQEYKKAEGELTISEELDLRKEVERLTIANADMSSSK